MRVAITCLQLIRDLDAWEHLLRDAGYEVVVPDVSGQHLEGDALVQALQGCVGVVAGDDQFSRNVLAALPQLRAIAKWGIGIDGIDLAAADELGISVSNTPGMFDDEVADVTMAYVVMLARDLVSIDQGVRDGRWPKPPGRSLRGMTLGIVGLGGIGRAVARRARVAGMRVLGVDPMPESRDAANADGVEVVDLEDLLVHSDVISLNCPLTESTRHLLDEDALSLTRRGVLVVNTSRGPVVDTEALVRALRSGRVAGAALDVMEQEPLPAGHALCGFERVVLGSHNASNTYEASARVHERSITNLLADLGGTS